MGTNFENWLPRGLTQGLHIGYTGHMNIGRISESRTARLPVPLTPDEHRHIKVKAAQSGVAMSDVARRFLLAWADGAVELPEVADVLLEQ